MEVPGTAGLSDSSCVDWWTKENDNIISQWRAVIASRNDSVLKQTLRQCHSALTQLLRKIQGLPAAVPSLSLELTVLYNTLIFQVNVAGGFTDEDTQEIEQVLVRVLDARGLVRGELSIEECWQKILLNTDMQQLAPALHRLAGLQGALWLAANQLEKLRILFEAISSTEQLPDVATSSHEPDHAMLTLLSTWNLPHDETTSPLLAQSSKDLKAILYTAAAFLQGLRLMEEGDSVAAAGILQEAAAGLCSRKVLAEIYTSIGCCYQKMGKPQMALQYWKQALQVDFQCLSALYQSLVLLRHLGKMDAELEALSLLHKALEGSSQGASSTSLHFLVRVELLVRVPAFLSAPSGPEVKYLLASRCLQLGRIEEAVEHYRDLMAVLQEEGWQPREFLHSLPRVPEVFLEATSALLQREQYQDALAVSDKIVSRITDLIPNRLTISLPSGDQGGQEQPEQSPGKESLPPQYASSPALSHEKTESLNCILWASAAYLHQGQALAHLWKHKDAITQFSRCINLLFKVQFVRIGAAGDEMAQEGLCRQEQVLQALKSFALLGRGCQFLKLEKDKEALRDLQLSLQANPGHSEATQNLLQVLWKLGRKQEAVLYWQKFQSASATAQQEAARRALPLYLLSQSKDSFPLDETLTGKIQDYMSTVTKDLPWP